MLQVINNAYLTKNEFVHYYFKRKKKEHLQECCFLLDVQHVLVILPAVVESWDGCNVAHKGL